MKRFKMFLGMGILAILTTLAWALVPSLAEADVPRLINFQGILKSGAGQPVADGSYSVTFKIYDAPSGGTILWMETQSVSTSSGLFTVLLGSSTPVPDSAFNDSSRYLGIAVAPDPEMSPRQKLSSVGYSYVSSQWTSAGAKLFRLNGNVGIGTANPSVLLDVVGTPAVFGTPTDSGDNRSLISVEDISPASLGVGAGIRFVGKYNGAGATSIFAGVKGIKENSINDNNQGALVFSVTGSGGVPPFERMRISSDGNVGIGTTSPSEKLQVSGTIHSTSGGFKFPDNSVQTSASGASLWAPSGSNIYNTNSGNVGIGTTNPTTLLHLNSGINFTPSVITLQDGVGRTLVLRSPGAGDAQVGTSTGHSLQLITVNTPRVFIEGGGAGKVGIGTTTPASKLTIKDQNTFLRLESDNPLGDIPLEIINTADGQNWQLRYIGTQKSLNIFDGTHAYYPTTWLPNGNVGIGTTSPTKKLEVAGSIKVGANDTIFSSNLSSNSPLQLQAPAGTTRMFISDATGNVGIGTSSPSERRLHIVDGANAGIRLQHIGVTPNADWVISTDAVNPPGGLIFYDRRAPAYRMVIDSTGNVGIGTTSPTKKLEVAGSIKVGANDTIFSSNLSSNSPLSLQAPAGTTRMFIDDATGNVGIGTTSPGVKLDVVASGSTASILFGLRGFVNNASTGPAYGGQFAAFSSGSGYQYGVQASAGGSSSGSNVGAYGTAYNTSTGSAYGGYFSGYSSGTGSHYGILGEAYGSSTSAATYGLYGFASSPSTSFLTIGTSGRAENTTGPATGGYFNTSSGSGYHYGIQAFGNGSSSDPTYGSYGSAFNSSTGTTYGSYGTSFNSSTGTSYGGYFTGGSSSGTSYGVYGSAGTYGVYGTGSFGVYGVSPSSFGVVADGGTGYGIYAIGSTYAGYFVGNTFATGTKSAAVKTDDGQYHLLYTQESPENWFEDFGTAHLVNGRVVVGFDPTFVQTVNTTVKYHVFLTPEGDCRGLYVTNETPSSFEIRELQNGKSELSVSYRIVAKRKGFESVRLAKMAGPTPEELQAEQLKRKAEIDKENAQRQQEQAKMEQERANLEKERARQEQERKKLEEQGKQGQQQLKKGEN